MNDNKTEQNTDGSSQKAHIFKPTERMVYYWKAFADPNIRPHVVATIERAIEMMTEDGIEDIPSLDAYRRNFYDWESREGYNEWRIKNWQKLMSESETFLDKVGLIKSAKDYRYWEGMQTKYHKFKKAVDFTTDGEKIQGNSEIINLIDELKAIRERVGEEGSERELQE